MRLPSLMLRDIISEVSGLSATIFSFEFKDMDKYGQMVIDAAKKNSLQMDG